MSSQRDFFRKQSRLEFIINNCSRKNIRKIWNARKTNSSDNDYYLTKSILIHYAMIYISDVGRARVPVLDGTLSIIANEERDCCSRACPPSLFNFQMETVVASSPNRENDGRKNNVDCFLR